MIEYLCMQIRFLVNHFGSQIELVDTTPAACDPNQFKHANTRGRNRNPKGNSWHAFLGRTS